MDWRTRLLKKSTPLLRAPTRSRPLFLFFYYIVILSAMLLLLDKKCIGNDQRICLFWIRRSPGYRASVHYAKVYYGVRLQMPCGPGVLLSINTIHKGMQQSKCIKKMIALVAIGTTPDRNYLSTHNPFNVDKTVK